jgi:uncharacterized protein (DUF1810 family)
VDEDEFQLSRFLEAQETSYATALEEIKSGKKRTHWIWYVFPQLKGLGTSSMSQKFGVSGLAEARRYLAHPVLGARLREITEALLSHYEQDAEAVFGELDAAKVRSCLTLFSWADPTAQLFKTALDRFYSGQPDRRTLELLSASREV